MTSLVQNQGKRKFILPEGEIAPLGTLEMDNEAAKKICASYPTELVIIKSFSAQPVEENDNEDDLTLKTKVELMEMLDEKGIDYKPIMNKTQLIALLKGE